MPEFQRLYTPTAFREERVLWRSTIQLNIVGSVLKILDALNRSSSSPQLSPSTSPRSHTRSLSRKPQPGEISEGPHYPDEYFTAPGSNGHRDQGAYSDPDTDSDDHNTRFPILDADALEALKMRLLPLRHIEALLKAKLVPPNEDEATHLGISSSSNNPLSRVSYKTQEIFVRPGPAWKGGLARARVHYPSSMGSDEDASSSDGRSNSFGNSDMETSDEPQEVLNECRDDIIQLWSDRGVRAWLHKRKIRLQEGPGLYVLFRCCCPLYAHSIPS